MQAILHVGVAPATRPPPNAALENWKLSTPETKSVMVTAGCAGASNANTSAPPLPVSVSRPPLPLRMLAPSIQRCQVHKARNITDRLAKPLHASVRKTLRQAWELNDAEKAERLIKNLARRLEQDYPGVSGSILEGIEEILTVTRLGLPVELRRSLACTNIIENMNGTIRQVCRNVKRWRDTRMALRWTGAAMQKAAKGFRRLRRLKAHKQLPTLRAALLAHQVKHSINPDIEKQAKAA